MANNERFLNWQEKMTERKGSRQSFNLQLDWDDPEDLELIKIIALLKDKQDFSKVMKMALKIIPAMMYESSLDELFSEFAWVKLEMLEYMKELQSEAEPATHDTASKDDIARLERLILQQSSPVALPTNGNSNGGLKPIIAQPKKLDVLELGKPDFDDDEEDEPLLVVQKDQDAGRRANENFLKSMMALQQA